MLARNERFKYSNIGYSLLGQVIESVTGQPYAEHVTDVDPRPAGLDDTRRTSIRATSPTTPPATPASSTPIDRLPIDHIATGAMASATGFSSTATDLVRWRRGPLPGRRPAC